MIGPEGLGEAVDVVLKGCKCKSFQYLGYLPKMQSYALPDSKKVKVKVMGFCSTPQGHDYEPIGEGWYILGLWIKTGVFIVTEDDKPISFFAPCIA